jgi:hypothetical protein
LTGYSEIGNVGHVHHDRVAVVVAVAVARCLYDQVNVNIRQVIGEWTVVDLT